MNRIYIFCTFLLFSGYAEAQALRPTAARHLTGVQLLAQEQQGNVNSILYHNGLIFLANQVEVDVYLYNRIIATYPYRDLTGRNQNNRKDPVVMEPVADGVVQVADLSGRGEIHYRENDSKRHEATAHVDTARLRIESNGFSAKGSALYYQGKRIGDLPSPVRALEFNPFRTQLTGGDKHVLVATESDGVFEYALNSRQLTPLDLRSPHGAPIKSILSLEYIPDGDAVVIGTCGDGAFLWSQRRDQVFTNGGLPNIEHDGQRWHFWSFAPVDGDHFLAGNDRGEVMYFSAEGGDPIAALTLESGEMVRCMARIGEGPDYLAGTRSGRIYQFRFVGGRFGGLRQVARDPVDGIIHIMRYDATTGRMLIGSRSGVWAWKQGKMTRMLDREVSYIVEGPDQTLYAGHEKHLYGYREGSWRPIEGFDHLGHVSNLLFLPSSTGAPHSVLVFTKGDFIKKIRFDGKRVLRVEKVYGEPNGMAYRSREFTNLIYSNDVNYGGVWSQERVWVSTNFGLVQMNPDEKAENDVVQFYSKYALGLPVGEFNTNAFMALDENRIVYGSRRGWVIVHTDKAVAERASTMPVQIWEMSPRDTLTEMNKLYVSRERFRYVDSNSVLTIDFGDKYSQIWVAQADYRLLSTPVVLLDVGNDTLNMASGRSIALHKLFVGEGNWLEKIGWVKRKSTIKSLVGSSENTIVKQMSGTLAYGIGALITIVIAGILFNVYFQKRSRIKEEKANFEKKMNQKEHTRRQFFIDLGKKLARAEDFEDIHKAVSESTREAQNIIGSSRIAVYIYEKELNHLRTVAWGDTMPLPGQSHDFQSISRVTYGLDDLADQQRPLVQLWKNRNRQDHLVVNHPDEFYKNGTRPQPKMGGFAQSFIFKTIKVNNEPIGVISIQDSNPDAYAGKQGQDILEMLDIMGYFLVITLGLAKERRERAVQIETVSMFNKIVEKRMSQHIAVNFVDKIGDKYPDAYATTNAFKKLISKIYTTPPLHYGGREIDVIRSYRVLSEFLYMKKFNIEFENDSIISAYRMPSFLLLNAVNNAMKHTDRDVVNITLSGELTDREWTLSVIDDGPGINFERLKARKEEGSSSGLWDEYFQKIKDTTGYEVQTRYTSPVASNRGARVDYVFPLGLVTTIFEQLTS